MNKRNRKRIFRHGKKPIHFPSIPVIQGIANSTLQVNKLTDNVNKYGYQIGVAAAQLSLPDAHIFNKFASAARVYGQEVKETKVTAEVVEVQREQEPAVQPLVRVNK